MPLSTAPTASFVIRSRSDDPFSLRSCELRRRCFHGVGPMRPGAVSFRVGSVGWAGNGPGVLMIGGRNA